MINAEYREQKMKLHRVVLLSVVTVLLVACGGGGGGGGGGGAAGGGGGGNAGAATGQQALQAEIDRLFPFTPDQPFEVLFQCGRSNSQLIYYFHLHADSTFDVYITLNNGQDVTFSGTYTYANGAIRLQSPNNPILALDETTTRIVPHLGLVGEFETANMRCGAFGHGYNDPATDTFRAYGCPSINIGPASDEENALEFVHSAVPFSFAVRGSMFRQRDVNVTGNNQPIITRGYGLYRRVGDTFYADFGNQFPDFNLLKGTFENGDLQLSVEQLQPSVGPCNRR